MELCIASSASLNLAAAGPAFYLRPTRLRSLVHVQRGGRRSDHPQAPGLATLIDGGAGGGSNEPLGHFLCRWLLDHNLKLKAFDASHPHIDHLNALTTLLQQGGDAILAKGATYFDNGEEYGKTLKKTLVAELGRHNLAVVHVKGAKNPTTFQLGSGVTAKLFTYPHASEGPNYQSVFMAVRFRNARFLFTGDVYEDYEKHLMQPPVTLEYTHCVRISSRQQPCCAYIFEQYPNILQTRVWVIHQGRAFLNHGCNLQAPGLHHVNNMKHRVMRCSQAKTKITSVFFGGQSLEKT